MSNILVLTPRTRRGEAGVQGTKTERRFVDLVVDGRSLFDAFRERGHHMVSSLWLPAAKDDDAQQLLQLPCELPSGRVAIFVCPECADVGCDAVAARITHTESRWCLPAETMRYTRGLPHG